MKKLLKNKVLWVVIAVIVVIVAATSGGNDNESSGAIATESTTTTTVTTEAPPQTTTEAPPSSEDVYLFAVRSVVPVAEFIPDDDLIELGKEMCSILDEANGDVEMVALGLVIGIQNNEYNNDPELLLELTGAILGAAPHAYCPHWQEVVNEAVSSY